MRAGRISIPAQYANLMAGGASLETLIRSTYAGHALNRAAGRQTDYANITDVPAYPWSLRVRAERRRHQVLRRRRQR